MAAWAKYSACLSLLGVEAKAPGGIGQTVLQWVTKAGLCWTECGGD